jgi:Tfp pilus assembly major pilin PilA
VRGRILLIGSMIAAIVVAVLTTVALLLVEPELSKAKRSRLAAWPAARSSRCMRCDSTTGVDAQMKRDTSSKATRRPTSASRVQ